MSEGTTEKIIQEAEQTLVPFYSRFARAFVRAKDHFLYDSDGREYVDFSSGIAVVSFGHCNRQINEAIKKQLDEISHISNIFYIPGQAELSKLISERSFAGKTFFCNSGAEANETALKIARMTGNAKSPSKNRVLALKGSFHGRTLATITMTGQAKYKKGLDPLLPGVSFVEFDSIDDLAKQFDDDVCAIFMEAIQGESGIRPMSPAFAAKVAELAKKHDALIVMDEVQCGIGRSGKYFGYQWLGIEPDIITMAKALGNGFPIGAAHVRPGIADKMVKGMHASTFGGNYIAMAAGIAALKQLDSKLLERIEKTGAYLESVLNGVKSKKPGLIGDIRRKGLMVGVDLNGRPVAEVIDAMLEKGFVTLRAGENTLRLVPPFTIDNAVIDKFGETLEEVL